MQNADDAKHPEAPSPHKAATPRKGEHAIISLSCLKNGLICFEQPNGIVHKADPSKQTGRAGAKPGHEEAPTHANGRRT
jgi:hypothetical protein